MKLELDDFVYYRIPEWENFLHIHNKTDGILQMGKQLKRMDVIMTVHPENFPIQKSFIHVKICSSERKILRIYTGSIQFPPNRGLKSFSPYFIPTKHKQNYNSINLFKVLIETYIENIHIIN